jgi:hypothetical protein
MVIATSEKESYLWFIPKHNKTREKDEDRLDAQYKA